MGTKGSFAIAMLTNMLFIKFCYNKYYPGLFDPFFLEVGDDMTLQDIDNKFVNLFEGIGVPINLNKTKSMTKLGSFVEYVSRNS